ncbi:hypothetical protein H0H92_015455 [Tricholoma furcatifolium]|nr:hypothetical protein H0H92_015455 [Tricholoma furcatifolium]
MSALLNIVDIEANVTQRRTKLQTRTNLSDYKNAEVQSMLFTTNSPTKYRQIDYYNALQSSCPFSAAVFAASVSKQLAGSPFASIGDVSIVYAAAGNDARMYFQPASGTANAGTISEYAISGPFDTGRRFGGFQGLVPASEVAQGSPVSATILTSLTNGFQEVHESSSSFKTLVVNSSLQIHVFFVSPAGILSEYFYDTAWHGGAGCGSACVTSLGFKVNSSTIAPTANQNANASFITVTFKDANNPGTLSQAIRRNGVWNTTLSTLS